ncbi:MAG: helix-turn-helix domain-containing protein [Pseudomonadota bacterium]
MPHATEDIIEALKKARKERGLTQRGLSEKAGIPQSHISKIESGAVDMKLSSLVELARSLGLEVTVIPRRLVPAVEALLKGAPSGQRRPAYSLEEEGDA